MTKLVRAGLVCATAAAAFAGAATAAPNENANCVAHAVLGPPGPPGQTQRLIHEPDLGQVVAFVATQLEGGSLEECGAP